MLTEKDKIEQFKRELKSYEYYQKKVQECNEELEVIAHKLQGVSSPTVKDVIYENAGNPYSNENKLQLMLEESELIKERDKYIVMIGDIDARLLKIHNADEREMIIDLYIKKINHEKVASDNYYANRAGMYKRINAILAKII